MNNDLKNELIYKKKRILVLGAGSSGISATHLLLNLGHTVTLYDDNPQPEIEINFFNGEINFCFSDPQKIKVEDYFLIIISPTIKESHPLIKKALLCDILFINEIDLGALFTPNNTTFIGITGSNGKSTTTMMLKEIIEKNKNDVLAAGNIGLPLCNIAAKNLTPDYIILELSSFQLSSIRLLKIDLGIILNLFPNHLDWHKDMRDYARAKLNLIKTLKNGCLVLADQGIAPYWSDMNEENIKFFDTARVINTSAFYAEKAAKHLGFGKKSIKEGLKSFNPLPHRFQMLGNKNGIDFINDSKGTTVSATEYALKKCKNKVHLIIGGIKKSSDFYRLKKAYHSNIAQIYIYGKDRYKIKDELGSGLICKFLKDCVKKAYYNANENEIILLSPGCSSLDQFENFEARGKAFKDMFKSL